MKFPQTFILFLFVHFHLAPLYGQWEFDFAIPSGNQEVGDLYYGSDGIVYAGLSDGVYQRSEAMPEWTSGSFPTITDLISDFAFPAPDLYFVIENDALYKSVDGGLSWEIVYPDPGYWWEVMVYVLPICDDEIMVVGEKTYYSSDLGDSWFYFGVGGTFFDRSIFSFDGNVLYHGGGNYNRYSLDCGDTWTDVSANLDAVITGTGESIINSYLVNGLLFAEVGGYVDHSNELYVSNDLGATWSYAHTGLPAFDDNDQFYFLEAVGPYLLAGIENMGVFISYDDGLTWEDFNEGLTSLEINSSAFASDGTWLFLGTDDGIFKRPLADLNLAAATGLVYLDENANEQQDPGEPGIPQHVLQVNGLDQYIITDQTGGFQVVDEFLEPVQIEAFPISPYAVLNPQVLLVDSPGDTPEIAVSFPGNEKDLSIDLTRAGPSRPGFETKLFLAVHNIGAVVQDASVHFTFDSNLEYLSAEPIPTSVDGNTLSWDINQLGLLSSESIVVNFLVPVDVNMGTSLQHTATVLPDANDETPSDNTVTILDEVVGSFDPNDKLVSQESLTPDEVDQQKALDFTIRFQNTGNFPAEFVRIEDTLDPSLNITSLRVLSSSHPYELSIDSSRTIQFFFDNIQLPDSTSNEPESHGFIKYSIQVNPDLEIGTVIDNTAGIYFDFNEPVITNTVQTVVVLPVSNQVEEEPEQKLVVVPNPSSGLIQILLEGDIRLDQAQLSLYNATGQLVMEGRFRQELDLRPLPDGMYWLVVRDPEAGAFFGTILLHQD